MIRRVSYICICLAMASCASKKVTTSIQSLETENKTLRGDMARLQEQVRSLSEDLLVVQSRVENHPGIPSPIAAAVKPAPVVEAPKKMYRQESFLGDDIHFTDDEPSAQATGSSLKFTNKDLSNLPPLVPQGKEGKAGPSATAQISNKNKPAAFGETTLVPDANKAEKTETKPAAEDTTVVAAYNRAYKTFKDQNYKETIRLMAEFLKQNPTHEYADNATFWIGESYFQMKNFEQANMEFENVISKYPNGNKVPDALLRSGICMLRLSRSEKAKSSFDQLIKKYPESVAAKRAKTTLGEL